MVSRRGVWALLAIVVVGVSLPAEARGSRPRVRIAQPDRGRVVAQGFVARGRAADDGRITRVRVSIDGGAFAKATCQCPGGAVGWRFVLPELAFGRHELSVVATDNDGRTGIHTTMFEIPEPARAYRAFTDDSWWNTPFPADAPRDPSSDRWIRRLRTVTRGVPLRLTGLPGSSPEQAQPVYFSTRHDPLYRIRPEHGPIVSVHIPRWAIASRADSPKMTVIDRSTDQGVGLTGAVFATDRWRAAGLDRYLLSSEGIAASAGGTEGNDGHRGATTVLKALRLEEVLLAPVERRAQCFVPPTLVGLDPVWPMVGSDGEHRRGIPEGIVLRIRPSVDLSSERLSPEGLVVATMLQDYGCLVSDGGAPHRVTLRLARADWSATSLDAEALASINWRSWEFVLGGFRP